MVSFAILLLKIDKISFGQKEQDFLIFMLILILIKIHRRYEMKCNNIYTYHIANLFSDCHEIKFY